MGLFIKYMSIHLKSQLQYRTSFILLTLGQFFAPLGVFAGMYLMFERFGGLPGWSLHEVALCYGVIHFAYSFSDCFGRGFDKLSTLVMAGDFDRLLVRPRSAALQVLGSRVEFSRIGRLLQSIAVFAWALSHLPQAWSLPKLLVLLFMIANGVLVFLGIFILAAAFCFWTVQALEVVNIFTDGGREMAQYPLNIYEKWVTRFFTFVIPFSCVSYIPLMYVLDKREGDPLLWLLVPFSGVLFLLPCLLLWRFGVRHYRSTGS